MPLTKREQILIDRLKKSGRPIEQAKIDAPFSVLVRPLATIGVDAGKFALWFEEEISTGIGSFKVGAPIKRIVISPHIIDPAVSALPPDSISFSRKENAVFVAIGIDYLKWSHSSDATKLTAIYENIRQSILSIPKKHLGDESREMLLSIAKDSHVKLQSRIVR